MQTHELFERILESLHNQEKISNLINLQPLEIQKAFYANDSISLRKYLSLEKEFADETEVFQ